MNMKKIITILFCIAGISSCKKNWTCTCIVQGAATQTYPINGLAKSDATTDCNNMAPTAKIASGGTGTVSCSI